MKAVGILIPDVEELFSRTINKLEADGTVSSFKELSIEDQNKVIDFFENTWVEHFHIETVSKYQNYLASTLSNQQLISEEHQELFKHFYSYNELSNKLFNNLCLYVEELSSDENIIITLYGELLRIADQVFILLLNGYPDGALRLWRTLHERTAVLLLLINKSEETDIITRFIHHSFKNDIKQIKSYANKYAALNFPKLDDDILLKMNDLRREYEEKYGKTFFDNDYGWADEILGQKKVNLSNIEDSVNLDKLRPYYNLSNSYIHSTFGSLKNFIEEGNIIKIKQVNAQTIDTELIFDPLQLTIFSLHEINRTLLGFFCVDYEYDINLKLFVKIFKSMQESFTNRI